MGFDLFNLEDVLENILLKNSENLHYRKIEVTESSAYRPFAVNVEAGSSTSTILHGTERYTFENLKDAMTKFKETIEKYETQGFLSLSN